MKKALFSLLSLLVFSNVAKAQMMDTASVDILYDTPTKAVEACILKLKETKFDDFSYCMPKMNAMMIEMQVKMSKEKSKTIASQSMTSGGVSTSETDVEEQFDRFLKYFTLEPMSENIKGDKAEVGVRLSFPEVISVFIRTLLTSGISLSDEGVKKFPEIGEKAKASVDKALEDETTPKATFDFNVGVLKRDGKWTMTEQEEIKMPEQSEMMIEETETETLNGTNPYLSNQGTYQGDEVLEAPLTKEEQKQLDTIIENEKDYQVKKLLKSVKKPSLQRSIIKEYSM